MRLQNSPTGQTGPLPADLEAIHDGRSLSECRTVGRHQLAAHTVDVFPPSSGGWTSEIQGPAESNDSPPAWPPATPLRDLSQPRERAGVSVCPYGDTSPVQLSPTL